MPTIYSLSLHSAKVGEVTILQVSKTKAQQVLVWSSLAKSWPEFKTENRKQQHVVQPSTDMQPL